jgi:hypothetical protein
MMIAALAASMDSVSINDAAASSSPALSVISVVIALIKTAKIKEPGGRRVRSRSLWL